MLTLYRSCEKTSGTSHQVVHGIMKRLEELVSTSRSGDKSLTPDLVSAMTKVMVTDCASSASVTERLFSDQFLSKATCSSENRAKKKFAASVLSKTSMSVCTQAEINSLTDEVESTTSGIMRMFLQQLHTHPRSNDADQSGPGRELKNNFSAAQKIHKNVQKWVFGCFFGSHSQEMQVALGRLS